MVGRLDVLGPMQPLSSFATSHCAWSDTPRDLAATWHGRDVALGFSLVAGAYATTVLAELVTLGEAPPGETEADDA